jgi:hypothetical protein
MIDKFLVYLDNPIVLGGFVLVGLALLFLVAWILREQRRRKEIKEHEKQAGGRQQATRSLRRLPSRQYKSWHGLLVPRFRHEGLTKLHHVVVSKYGIFVIQVQQEQGLIVGEPGDRHWESQAGTDSKVFPNPLIRNQYHVRSLARCLELPEALFFSIIHFEHQVRFAHPQPGHVLTTGLGRYIIAHRTELIAPELQQQISARLQQIQSQGQSNPAHQSNQGSREELEMDWDSQAT